MILGIARPRVDQSRQLHGSAGMGHRQVLFYTLRNSTIRDLHLVEHACIRYKVDCTLGRVSLILHFLELEARITDVAVIRAFPTNYHIERLSAGRISAHCELVGSVK